ncbi:MAG: hypothetical protein EOM12_13170 [Verrucomicrobiae bacterium]|nr:hypothetical protein [Verrucomicrobiae bacterium]
MIPAFSVLHQNLSSLWLKPSEYVDWLKEEFFNGFMELSGQQGVFYEFFLLGEPVNVIKKSGEGFSATDVDIVDLFNEGVYRISAYYIPESHVSFFSRFDALKNTHPKLSSDIVNLLNLIVKLKNEKSTGVLKCMSKKTKKEACVYFSNGSIAGFISSDTGIIFQKSNEVLKGLIDFFSSDAVYDFFEFASKGAKPYEGSSGNRKTLIQAGESFLNAVSSAIGQDAANKLIREACIGLSRHYEFLDPFSGEFEFKNGKLDVWEQVSTPVLKNGMVSLAEELGKKVSLPDQSLAAKIKSA